MTRTTTLAGRLATAAWIGLASPALCADGLPAIDMLKGDTMHGLPESGANEYFLYLAPDGVVQVFYRNLNKHDQGRWAAKDAQLCSIFRAAPSNAST